MKTLYTEVCLVYSKNSKEHHVAIAEWARGKPVEDKVRKLVDARFTEMKYTSQFS